MSAVDPKYLTSSPSNHTPSDKEKKDDNIMFGTEDEANPLKVDDDDDGKAHSLAPHLDDEEKPILLTPPSTKGTHMKKKAKK